MPRTNRALPPATMVVTMASVIVSAIGECQRCRGPPLLVSGTSADATAGAFAGQPRVACLRPLDARPQPGGGRPPCSARGLLGGAALSSHVGSGAYSPDRTTAKTPLRGEVSGMGKPSKSALSNAGSVLASNGSSKPAKSKAGSTLGKG